MTLPSQKGLMIAAPQSGSGKTVVTLALLRALKNGGVDIRAAKAGPDYIDPAFHGVACGNSSVNLDPWAMSPDRCHDLALGQSGSHLLVESMMGLFDGAADGSGSGADLAQALGLPIVLVVDASKQSHSIAALVHGFRDHQPVSSVQPNICGVILNKVGSARHGVMLRQALSQIDMPVLGCVGRNAELVLPERHLGLVQAGEVAQIEDFVEKAAQIVGDACDLDGLLACFAPLKERNNANPIAQNITPPGQNIAIARDAAFSFIYPHLLRDWQKQGAQLSFFSPLADEGPKQNADAVFLPGGYPELHAGQLSSAEQFRSGMEAARLRGALIYGECGGYMVLGNGLVDADGARHAMLGFLNVETSFQQRKLHLGYRVAKSRGDFFGGLSINAHEFHYTSILKQEGAPLFSATDAMGEPLGEMGLRDENVMGSYLHFIDEKTS